MRCSEAVTTARRSYPAVLTDSSIIMAIRHADAALKMPPKKRLSDETVEAFTAWVKAGAPWPAGGPSVKPTEPRGENHWAFQPIRTTEPPADPSAWSISPIDRFIAARHRAEGVHPSGPADRTDLDPPRHVRPDRPAADARGDRRLPAPTIARRLSRGWSIGCWHRPHYGERWGRHWMDVVRYADTAGDNADYPVPEAGSLPRLHHRRVQRRQALRRVRPRATRRRRSGRARAPPETPTEQDRRDRASWPSARRYGTGARRALAPRRSRTRSTPPAEPSSA